jgi:hypothetical protein
MGLRGERRKVNMKDEYYVRITGNIGIGRAWADNCTEIAG